MIADLPTLQLWRDRLFESRLSGIREVRDQNGETIVYRSDTEMARAIAAADAAIATASRGSTANTILFNTVKGV